MCVKGRRGVPSRAELHISIGAIKWDIVMHSAVVRVVYSKRPSFFPMHTRRFERWGWGVGVKYLRTSKKHMMSPTTFLYFGKCRLCLLVWLPVYLSVRILYLLVLVCR